MNTVITAEKIELPPGAVLKLLGNWQDYERMVLQRNAIALIFPPIHPDNKG